MLKYIIEHIKRTRNAVDVMPRHLFEVVDDDSRERVIVSGSYSSSSSALLVAFDDEMSPRVSTSFSFSISKGSNDELSSVWDMLIMML